MKKILSLIRLQHWISLVIFIVLIFPIIIRNYEYMCHFNGRYDNAIGIFSQVVASLLGILLIVIIYQYTILIPNLFEPSDRDIDSVKLEMSGFIYWNGFLSFFFFLYSILSVLILRLFGGINQISFCLSLFVFLFFRIWIDIFDKELKNYFRLLNVYSFKRLIYFTLVLLMYMQQLLFVIAPFYDSLNFISHIDMKLYLIKIYLSLSILIVVFSLVFTIDNMSFPFAVGLDYFRYGKERDKLYKLIHKYKTNKNKISQYGRKDLDRIIKEWALFNRAQDKRLTYNINLPKLERDIERIKDIIDSEIDP